MNFTPDLSSFPKQVIHHPYIQTTNYHLDNSTSVDFDSLTRKDKESILSKDLYQQVLVWFNSDSSTTSYPSSIFTYGLANICRVTLTNLIASQLSKLHHKPCTISRINFSYILSEQSCSVINQIQDFVNCCFSADSYFDSPALLVINDVIPFNKESPFTISHSCLSYITNHINNFVSNRDINRGLHSKPNLTLLVNNNQTVYLGDFLDVENFDVNYHCTSIVSEETRVHLFNQLKVGLKDEDKNQLVKELVEKSKLFNATVYEIIRFVRAYNNKWLLGQYRKSVVNLLIEQLQGTRRYISLDDIPEEIKEEFDL